MVTVYLPLLRLPVRAAVPVLLDGDHVVEARRRAALARPAIRSGSIAPTLDALRQAAVRDRLSRSGCGTRCWSRWSSTFVSLVCLGARRLCDRAAALHAAPSRSAWRSSSPTWCRRRSCSSRWPTIVFKLGLFDTRWALILTYPTFLIPFCTWLLMGYFRSIPYELEECALIDGATRWQILIEDHPAAGGAGPDLGRHLRLHAVVERVHLRADLHLVVGDQDGAGRRRHRAGARATSTTGAPLMAGALLGSLPVAVHLLVLRRVLRLRADRRGQGIASGDRDERRQEAAQEARGAAQPAMVRPPGPRRLRLPQLGQGQGRAARPVRRPAGDRHLQHLQRADALQLAFPHARRAGQDRRLRGRRLSARVPGDVARRDAAAADRDALSQPRQHGRRGIDPRQPDRRRRAADGLRQDDALAGDGRGERRPADDRRLAAGRCSTASGAARSSARAPASGA